MVKRFGSMNSYRRIKNNLEQIKGVKVEKTRNMITIKQRNKVLTTYDLKFTDYSKDNTENFIKYWTTRLNERGKRLC